MSFADLSIKRPIFIVCLVLVMLAVGYRCLTTLGVDQFPNVTLPVVTVTIPYAGASPDEIATLIAKPVEDQLSTISGIKRLSSQNQEGVAVVIAEFFLETDVKYAEQQVRDRVSSAKRDLPKEIDEPVIRRIDPGDQAVLVLSLDADLPPAALYSLADQKIRPKLEQVDQVGQVEIVGGREREIHVNLDRKKLKNFEISATQVANRLTAAGENTPVGKVDAGKQELSFRAIGQFGSVSDIKRTIVNFFGSDVPVTVADVGYVEDTVKDETSRAFVNGKKAVLLNVYRQNGSNTIEVVERVLKQVKKINELSNTLEGHPHLTLVRDGTLPIRANVDDVEESIYLGVLFAVIVVYFFLANGRSTFITGLALPNSLLGAFILMAAAGFTVNIMTLLALSLAVGLLIDDAIVVRENIFRHIEMGKSPMRAALEGTKEVQLAVVATTFTILAVFGPVAFLKGVVGQFFREFGLTICFAMLISLFDALTIAPMFSAYFAGDPHAGPGTGFFSRTVGAVWRGTIGRLVGGFSRFQDWLEEVYERSLKVITRHPLLTMAVSFVIFALCTWSLVLVPKTFLPANDTGEFQVAFDLPPGASLDQSTTVAFEMDGVIRANKEVAYTSLTIGAPPTNQANTGSFYISLVPSKQRPGINTTAMKNRIREELKKYSFANVIVKDYDPIGAGQRPFVVNIIGQDAQELEAYTFKTLEWMKKNPDYIEPDMDYRLGKPELQVAIDKDKADKLGVSTSQVGMELRTQIEGTEAAKFREKGEEYKVRVRLQPDQRNLQDNFNETYVPNINMNVIRLRDVASAVQARSAAKVTRQDRSRDIQIQSEVNPKAGMAKAKQDLESAFHNEIKLPPTLTYAFLGQAESFAELGDSISTAFLFAVLFIYLILSSLYESFVTPITIMMALPLAICGAFLALAITQQDLNIFSMIGVIMLLGVATKNSILLVDYANQKTAEGMDRVQAIILSGKTRLRPILMTTMALVAGTIPIAIGLNEASKQRTSMGIAIIGGLVSSTLLTLVVVPAVYLYVERFRIWSSKVFFQIVGGGPDAAEVVHAPAPHKGSGAHQDQ